MLRFVLLRQLDVPRVGVRVQDGVPAIEVVVATVDTSRGPVLRAAPAEPTTAIPLHMHVRMPGCIAI